MKTTSRFTLAVTALAVGSVTLAACAGSAVGASQAASSGEAPEEIVIGALHPLSGSNAVDGQQMSNAAQMAVDAINDAGGIESLGGAKLVLEAADTRGEPETGQSEATRLIQEGAAALVGSYQSATSANIASVAERNGVPFVMDVSALDSILEQGYTNSFRIQPSASMMGEQSATYLSEIAEAAGTPVTKVGYLYEQGNFGASAYEAFAAKAQEYGITVEPAISYDPSSSDLSTQVQQVAAAGADVLAVSGYYNDSLAIARAVSSIAPDLDAVFGVANGGYDQVQFTADAPNGGENYFDANYRWDATNDEAVAVAAAFEAEFGEPMRTSAMLTYDAVTLIAEAIDAAGSADPADIRDAIAATTYEPHVVNDGPVSFDETGQNVNASVVTMQVLGGAVTQVYPAALAQQPLVYPAPVR
ncbi:branched-chain amino acid ABC transporter substrate-binding protein [Microbacterium sp. TS-1]|uniref:ABC transporter substrate-binding protein n=1 Tax=Microbacterium sp. TS-1 TaxID=1344956 RepID=UPI00038FA88F|nr:ABC transporter substrate-binding protein [Microbacterium sp. TS-1]GAD34614.1 branched-chain amino acid ABC transporter substrate-binding protein [Microbacterium sp. TS-1]